MFGLGRAPEINVEGLHWFNVDQPLSLVDLRGRMVILDFWTFCCINCIQVVPTLRQIEQAFPEDVVVIGVHSPKFTAERAPGNVAHAIQRYGIRHPVVHDPHMIMWKKYAVRAWPTLVFISPDGKMVGQLPGEPDPEAIIEGIKRMLSGWREDGSLKPCALPLADPVRHDGTLCFPGKIKSLCNVAKIWAVASGGHHQVVLFDDSGTALKRIGKGSPGFSDGDFTTAAFDCPQGIACAGDFIFVADTGNHAIRRINLKTEQVDTLAGTGRRGLELGAAQPGTETDLASVWDLEHLNGQLYFANAGTHQLGLYRVAEKTVEAFAGTGEEDIADGPALQAHLAQPSGLALNAEGTVLYFADSETSAVRSVSLGTAPRVETLVGKGPFDFGDRSGSFEDALMQHPLGITSAENAVLVADSYNGSVKRLDLVHQTVTTIDHRSLNCLDAVCLLSGEPSGITADGPNRLLLSDTNNHRIVEYRLDQRTTRTWAA